jgi:hypothetical protein
MSLSRRVVTVTAVTVTISWKNDDLFFVLCSLFRTSDFVEGTSLESKRKRIFSLCFAHFFVPLQQIVLL